MSEKVRLDKLVLVDITCPCLNGLQIIKISNTKVSDVRIRRVSASTRVAQALAGKQVGDVTNYMGNGDETCTVEVMAIFDTLSEIPIKYMSVLTDGRRDEAIEEASQGAGVVM